MATVNNGPCSCCGGCKCSTPGCNGMVKVTVTGTHSPSWECDGENYCEFTATGTIRGGAEIVASAWSGVDSFGGVCTSGGVQGDTGTTNVSSVTFRTPYWYTCIEPTWTVWYRCPGNPGTVCVAWASACAQCCPCGNCSKQYLYGEPTIGRPCKGCLNQPIETETGWIDLPNFVYPESLEVKIFGSEGCSWSGTLTHTSGATYRFYDAPYPPPEDYWAVSCEAFIGPCSASVNFSRTHHFLNPETEIPVSPSWSVGAAGYGPFCCPGGLSMDGTCDFEPSYGTHYYSDVTVQVRCGDVPWPSPPPSGEPPSPSPHPWPSPSPSPDVPETSPSPWIYEEDDCADWARDCLEDTATFKINGLIDGDLAVETPTYSYKSYASNLNGIYETTQITPISGGGDILGGCGGYSIDPDSGNRAFGIILAPNSWNDGEADWDDPGILLWREMIYAGEDESENPVWYIRSWYVTDLTFITRCFEGNVCITTLFLGGMYWEQYTGKVPFSSSPQCLVVHYANGFGYPWLDPICSAVGNCGTGPMLSWFPQGSLSEDDGSYWSIQTEGIVAP